MPTRKRSVRTLEEERTLFLQEQTLLSKERTVLSFMQTGLAFIGVGTIISNVLAELPYKVLGITLVAIGLLEVFESWRRLRRYKQKLLGVKRKLGVEYV